jgi:hypothetical protein
MMVAERWSLVVGILACTLGLPAAAQEDAAEASSPACRLHDVAHAVGLDFVHDRGTTPERHLVETMGAGLAWLDYDGDGWLDLYLVQSGPFPPRDPRPAGAGNRLFRNLGPGRGEGPIAFEEVTGAAGVGDRGYGMGAVAADVDGDGDPDLLVTNYGPDVFYLNRGDGTFEEATARVGVGTDGWSSSGAYADADLDGDLDLYLSRYVIYDVAADTRCEDPETGRRLYCDPAMFEGATDRFFLNRLERGNVTFEDATAAAGLSAANGRGLGVQFTDLDGDLFPDLYVANDETINFLFRNRGRRGAAGAEDGVSFEDLSLLSGTAVNMDGKPEAGMGVVTADFDHDGDADLAITNFDVETNTYYENLGQMQFADASAASGFGVPSFNLLGFGMVAADLDGDGDLDTYTANGHIFFQPRRPNVTYAQRDLILLGDGRGRFSELRCPFLERDPKVGRGLAVADADRDGDPDLGIVNNGGPFQLLASELPGYAGGAFGVRLRGGGESGGANREAVGARIDLVAGEIRRRRWITAGDSYQSSSDRAVLFSGADAPEALEISWPDGDRLKIVDPPTGVELVIYER